MASTADSTLYLYTSLTAGSSHIITATSRLETILKAHKIPFRAVDCATDEKARMLWGRRSRGRKLPGLVKFGNVIGDIEQVEEWNEFGELPEQIEAADFTGVNPDAVRTPHPSAALPLDMKPPDSSSSEPPSRASSQGRHISISEPTQKPKGGGAQSGTGKTEELGVNAAALRQLGAEAAAKAAQRKTTPIPIRSAATPVENQSTKPAAEVESKAKQDSSKVAVTETKTEAESKSKQDTPASKASEEQALDAEQPSTQTKQPSSSDLAEAAAEASKPAEAIKKDPEEVTEEVTEAAKRVEKSTEQD